MQLLAYFISVFQPFRLPLSLNVISLMHQRGSAFSNRDIKWRDSCPNCDWGARAAPTSTRVRNYGPYKSQWLQASGSTHNLIAYCCCWQSLNFFMGWLTAQAQRSTVLDSSLLHRQEKCEEVYLVQAGEQLVTVKSSGIFTDCELLRLALIQQQGPLCLCWQSFWLQHEANCFFEVEV